LALRLVGIDPRWLRIEIGHPDGVGIARLCIVASGSVIILRIIHVVLLPSTSRIALYNKIRAAVRDVTNPTASVPVYLVAMYMRHNMMRFQHENVVMG